LIFAYRLAYSSFRLATIDSLLAPGFRFEFSPIDVDSFQIEPTWGRDEELRSIERMFSGEEGRWPTGEARPPLDTELSINPQLIPVADSEWIEGAEPGHFVRSYSTAMILYYIEGIDIVSGVQTFEVVDISGTGGPDGQSASGYAILNWHDGGILPPPLGFGEASPPTSPARSQFEGVRAVHAASWGYVKASFREPE
jgi:hypothetical protein